VTVTLGEVAFENIRELIEVHWERAQQRLRACADGCFELVSERHVARPGSSAQRGRKSAREHWRVLDALVERRQQTVARQLQGVVRQAVLGQHADNALAVRRVSRGT
jgi:hypothetical protein